MSFKGPFLSRPVGAVLALLLLAGCGSVERPGDLDELAVLTVKYGLEGETYRICDDNLPVVDGIAVDAEWASADPLYLRVRGEEGTGGQEVIVEIRAIWTDTGSRDDEFDNSPYIEDRMYMLIRYSDNDRNDRPDMLAYASLNEFGDWLPGPEPPLEPANACEPGLEDERNWTRINADGQEDQVLILLAEDDDENDLVPTDLIEANRVLMPALGARTPPSYSVGSFAANLDVWLWRAGRTNRHPIYQQSRWASWSPGQPEDEDEGLEIERPAVDWSEESNFLCAFMEDMSTDNAGQLTRDSGRIMYVQNFQLEGADQGLPRRITEGQPDGGRDGPSEDELKAINGSISPELGLWWSSSQSFSECTTVATARVGSPVKWSTRPLPGGLYDYMFGWGLQTPDGSQKDVRARGVFDFLEERGNTRWTIEMVRNLNTKGDGDLLIDPAKTYKMVIGILDNSSTTGSGSRVITVVFEPKPNNVPRISAPTWGKC